MNTEPYLLSTIAGLLALLTGIVGWFAVMVLSKGDKINATVNAIKIDSAVKFTIIKDQIIGLQKSTDKIQSDTTEYKKVLATINVKVEENSEDIKEVKLDLNDIKKKVTINKREIEQIKYIRDQAELILEENKK